MTKSEAIMRVFHLDIVLSFIEDMAWFYFVPWECNKSSYKTNLKTATTVIQGKLFHVVTGMTDPVFSHLASSDF